MEAITQRNRAMLSRLDDNATIMGWIGTATAPLWFEVDTAETIEEVPDNEPSENAIRPTGV